ncbi:related to ubiquinol cytochrome c reductase kDa subunit [Lecanosticta acicola]|uniref:Related to ubiquinol cytochrome c reductase kDa subunit n=1 Tax=Lecanosticta acicola TaxID=111012 RepID=A0AAI8Z249_9PEZI|nr:related to ubiquinol cytochrome c reductase kDa subunit [Lecanosticta acicola]
MQPTLTRKMPGGVRPWRQPQKASAYKSPYGPQYKVPFNIIGIDMTRACESGGLAAGFGGVAGVFALFFFDGVPRVQRDILQKIPFIGNFFVHEIPPEDNPF